MRALGGGGQLGQLRLSRGAVAVADTLADGLGLQADVGQHLPGAVVELAGQPFALLQRGQSALLGQQ